MSPDPRRSLAETFDGVAELYERVRPSYPARLFDDLAALSGMAGGSAGSACRVLEIGPGTGQATRGLLRRGWSVVALEPGPRLAAVARQVLAGLGDARIEVAPFETWPDRGETFDLVFAATAWHWLDPAVAYRKAARLLRPGGCLAVVATEHVLPEPDGDDFFRDAEAAYDAVGLGDGQGGPPRPDAVTPPAAAEIIASGYFLPPAIRRYVWSQRYTAQQYLDLLGTYSGHIAATDAQRQELYARLTRLIHARPDAAVRKHYLNVLHVARRVPPAKTRRAARAGAGGPPRTTSRATACSTPTSPPCTRSWTRCRPAPRWTRRVAPAGTRATWRPGGTRPSALTAARTCSTGRRPGSAGHVSARRPASAAAARRCRRRRRVRPGAGPRPGAGAGAGRVHRVLRPGGHVVVYDAHHDLVLLGSVPRALGPAGEPGLVVTYRHTTGDCLRAALSAGLQVRRCEEPRQPKRDQPPAPPADITVTGWEDWPWSLMELVSAALRAAAGPPVIVWHFQLAES